MGPRVTPSLSLGAPLHLCEKDFLSQLVWGHRKPTGTFCQLPERRSGVVLRFGCRRASPPPRAQAANLLCTSDQKTGRGPRGKPGAISWSACPPQLAVTVTISHGVAQLPCGRPANRPRKHGIHAGLLFQLRNAEGAEDRLAGPCSQGAVTHAICPLRTWRLSDAALALAVGLAAQPTRDVPSALASGLQLGAVLRLEFSLSLLNCNTRH